MFFYMFYDFYMKAYREKSLKQFMTLHENYKAKLPATEIQNQQEKKKENWNIQCPPKPLTRFRKMEQKKLVKIDK